MTAQEVARYILRAVGPVSLGNLNNIVASAQLAAYRDLGRPLFDEPMFAVATGFSFKGITADWLRRECVSMRRGSRQRAALRLRVRRWAIQEERKRGGRDRCHKLNIPGGWSTEDARAQRVGLIEAWGPPS